jgi:hypothetical protein
MVKRWKREKRLGIFYLIEIYKLININYHSMHCQYGYETTVIEFGFCAEQKKITGDD